MKIIFDLDDVILDSHKMKQKLFEVLAARIRGVNESESEVEERVRNIYSQWRGRGKAFSYREFMVHVDQSLGFSWNVAEQDGLYNKIFNLSKDSINEEVFKIMQTAGKENCYILTHGNDEDQMEKIKRSIGIEAAREILIVTESKAEEIKRICMLHKEEDVIFVDDKALHFADIRTEGCENLKTVLFDERGLEKLQAEIAASQTAEQNRGPKLEQNNLLPQSPTGQSGLH